MAVNQSTDDVEEWPESARQKRHMSLSEAIEVVEGVDSGAYPVDLILEMVDARRVSAVLWAYAQLIDGPHGDRDEAENLKRLAGVVVEALIEAKAKEGRRRN